MLGLVDQQDGIATPAMIFQQVAVQAVGEGFQGVPVVIVADAQLVADRGQQFHGIEGRIEDDGNVGIIRQLFQQAAVDRGLAGAHFTGEQDEAAAGAHPIQQMRQGVPVAGAHEQVARVDRY